MLIKFATIFDPVSEFLSRINYTHKSFGSAKTAIFCILTCLNLYLTSLRDAIYPDQKLIARVLVVQMRGSD